MGRRIVAILVGVLIGKAAAVAADGSPALGLWAARDQPAAQSPAAAAGADLFAELVDLVRSGAGVDRPALSDQHLADRRPVGTQVRSRATSASLEPCTLRGGEPWSIVA
jgi:hypothetical protein